MLKLYQKNYQKIAIGFLSLIRNDISYNSLTEELNNYLNESDLQVLLWSKNEASDFSALVIINIKENVVVIEALSVNPSEDTEATIDLITTNIQERFPEKTVMGTLDTKDLVNHDTNNEEE